MSIQFSNFHEYFEGFHPNLLFYSWNGCGKTTLAGKTGMKTIYLDCGDAGVMSLRKGADPKKVKFVRIRSTNHYIEVIDEVVRRASSVDLLVVDTLTGLQSQAIREVKGKGGKMSRNKWGDAGSKVIECISETCSFPKDIIYLAQEKRKVSEGDGGDEQLNIAPSLMPSVREYLSSKVDWVGRLYVEQGQRKLSFILSETLEAKDRSDLFPKVLKLPPEGGYRAIRERIVKAIHE